VKCALEQTRFRKLALLVVGIVAAFVVTGASAADFEADSGPCPEPPGGGAVLRCPTAYVGAPYQVQIESEDGSGCEPYVWYEVVNSALPGGLSMTRDGLISGTPTGAGLTRFWLWNHDLTAAQGGPSWCAFDDRSEREFSIAVDPGLAIVNTALKQATIGEPYLEALAARQVVSLNPLSGPDVQATWSLQSGSLPPGISLSTSGALTGTSTTEGSYEFVVRAQNGGPQATKTYTLSVRQPVVARSPFPPAGRPSGEVGVRFARTPTATGGSGSYTWSLSSGTLPVGLALDAANGTVSGTPTSAGTFALGLTATDTEGRVATVNGVLAIAPRLAIKTVHLKAAKRARTYRATLAASGGVEPLRWKVVRGRLPRGIRLSQNTGTFVGTPRRVGTFRVRVEARDALGARSQQALILLVNA
jgi:large repetitive protein